MIFKQIPELVSGLKTQTRRVRKNSEYVAIFDEVKDTFDYIEGKPQNQGVMSVDKRGHVRIKWQVGRTYAVTPKMYQPALTDIRIRITEIRSEHLHQITEDDARAEGVPDIKEYKRLWESINTRKGTRWQDNPLVWVITFEVVEV